jgi:hypothetical protein
VGKKPNPTHVPSRSLHADFEQSEEIVLMLSSSVYCTNDMTPCTLMDNQMAETKHVDCHLCLQ